MSEVGIGMPISHVLFQGVQIVAGDVEKMNAFLEFVLMGAEKGTQLVDGAVKPFGNLIAKRAVKVKCP